MKKLFAVCALMLVSSCYMQRNNEKVTEVEETNYPKFVVETPEGLRNLYDETNVPQLYSVVASRATNKMLEQTTDLYEKTIRPKLYVMQVKKAGVDYVPNGFFYARQVTREIIDGSKTYQIVNTIEEAEYLLEILVTKLDVPNMPGNVLQYKLVMLDKENKQIGTWIENIRQVQNDDRSWW